MNAELSKVRWICGSVVELWIELQFLEERVTRKEERYPDIGNSRIGVIKEEKEKEMEVRIGANVPVGVEAV